MYLSCSIVRHLAYYSIVVMNVGRTALDMASHIALGDLIGAVNCGGFGRTISAIPRLLWDV
jgi:hypothetical protein